jgi:hypothetical protein
MNLGLPLITVATNSDCPAVTHFVDLISDHSFLYFALDPHNLCNIEKTTLELKEITPERVFHYHVICVTKSQKLLEEHFLADYISFTRQEIISDIFRSWLRTSHHFNSRSSEEHSFAVCSL